MAVKRQRHTRPKFTGVLSKPIDIPDELIIALHTYNEPQHTKTAIMNEVSSYVSQQRSERIIALVKHYKIDANHYPNLQTFLYDLLLKVAEDFIDGFKSGPGKKPSHRPRGSTKGDSRALAMQVRLLTWDGKLTVNAACHHLSKRRGSEWYQQPPAALVERYRRECKAERERIAKFEEDPLYSALRRIKSGRDA
jgi:hypothetical protein